MSPLRLNAGRVVDPLEKPRVAAARELSLPAVMTAPFPLRTEVVLRLDGQAEVHRPALAAVPPVEIPLAGLSYPVILPLAARVLDTEGITQELPVLDAGGFIGGEFARWQEIPAAGPPAEIDLEPLGEPGMLDGFRPYLEPAPALGEATPIADFPHCLRPYQVEACQALLKNESFLLADSPGTGKTVVACSALLALFHQDQARRALIVCQERGLRHWLSHLSMWSPGLRVSLARSDPDGWAVAAHVHLTDYTSLAAAMASGALPEAGRVYDVLILDDLHGVRRKDTQPLLALESISAERRWALAGALPRHPMGWLEIFSLLMPDRAGKRSDMTLPDLRRRFQPYTLRRSKADLAAQLPAQTRQEVWVDLDPAQATVYQEELAEERHRLAKLGTAVTRTHIANAAARLKQACNFMPGTLDSSKVRALIDLVEDITAGGLKVVVFSQFTEKGLDNLAQVLEPYGMVRLDSGMSEADQKTALERFRVDKDRLLLLADPDVRPSSGPLEEATYIVHFDHDWNPAVRRRVERRLHPDGSPITGVSVYELWVADSFETRLYRVLADSLLLPGGLTADTRPADLEERLTLDDWLRTILEVPEGGAMPRLAPPTSSGTGRLPGTEMLKKQVSEMQPAELLTAVSELMRAWGFPQADILRGPDEDGGDLMAARESEQGREQLLVRCMRGAKDVGVGEGRSLLSEMHNWENCIGTYLVATADFTAACKKLADESRGRLALVSGVELYRHLHLLGAVG